jgi:hypothetical protein
MTGKLEIEIRDSYHVLAIALELLADIHSDNDSLLYIDSARRHAERLYMSAISNMVSLEIKPE